MTWHGSSAHSREVGEELRKRRQHVGLTGAELAKRLGWSGSKVSRIESGLIGVSEVDAAIYLTYCGVLREELDEILDLVREDSTPTWLQERGGRLPDELRTLVYHETTAMSIASYEPTLIPGLLQTEAYALALFEFANLMPKDRMAAAAKARIDRQGVLRRMDPPECEFFIHETGLRSRAGSNQTMNQQLLHLVFLTTRPQYQIRVVPAAAGTHGVWGGMFTLMGYPNHGPVVFVESMTTGLFLEKPDHIAVYQGILKRLDQAALDTEQSRRWLADLASEFDMPEVVPHGHP